MNASTSIARGIVLFALLIGLATVAHGDPIRFDGHKQISIEVRSQVEWETLQTITDDVWYPDVLSIDATWGVEVGPGRIEFRVTPEQFDRLAQTGLTFDVLDADGDTVSLSFRMFSDETEIPETGDGTGKHAPDFKNELGGRGLLVRSERRGKEDGRIYVLVVTADDGRGGVVTLACAAAACPHGQDQASMDDAIAQAIAGAALVQTSIDNGGALPPGALHEHGLSGELGPKQ